jgi:Ran GTPase-activating protein (RanGAP) involved in mRNA processing and transport
MSTLDQPKSSTTEQQVFECSTAKLASIETSLISMRQKISDFESGLRKTLNGLEISMLQNPTDANHEIKNVQTVIQSVKDSSNLTVSDQQGDFCLNQSIVNYLETKQTLDYLAKKDMMVYLEKRDMLDYLAKKDMAAYLQKSSKQQPEADLKCTEIFEEDSQHSNSEKSPVNYLGLDTVHGKPVKTTQEIQGLVGQQTLPVPVNKTALINYPSKLIMPFMHIKIESFETLGELADQSEWQADLRSFKENLITCAKNGADVELLSFMGNSYSMNFFKEASGYVKNLGMVQKVILNDCFAQRKDDLCESLKFLTSALSGKKTIALDISHNAIGANGCEALRDFFETNKDLEYLWADNIGLSQTAVPIFCDSLISGAPPLKLLSLARNKIETTAPKIAQLTSSLPTLKDFTIFANSIKSDSMAVLIKSLETQNNLERLDIHDNFLDKNGFNSILEMIKYGLLKGLNISDSNIEESWNTDLVAALKIGRCNWEEFSDNYGEIYDSEIKDDLVYELIKSGNLLYLSLLGMDWEEEEAQKVSEKMKSAIGND